jgi:hypothetical protein
MGFGREENGGEGKMRHYRTVEPSFPEAPNKGSFECWPFVPCRHMLEALGAMDCVSLETMRRLPCIPEAQLGEEGIRV